MKFVFAPVLAMAGQLITMQAKEVVHLSPHSDAIDYKFGGKLVELINAPPVVYLSPVAPKPSAEGTLWTVDIKNLGPAPVTVTGLKAYTRILQVGETVHVVSNGTSYSIRH